LGARRRLAPKLLLFLFITYLLLAALLFGSKQVSKVPQQIL
jgi:hypothetical protein